jgi:Holliday junction resolvasome RuvABC endonuclease subunit
MTVLAIDLGRHMGWVLGKPVGPLEFGTIELENTTDLGRYLASMVDPLRPLMRRCSAIAVEQPIVGGAASGYHAIRKNFAALGMVHYLAHIYGVASVTEISVTTGKLTLAGNGRADKDAMIFAAIERGLDMPNEHEADALGIFWVHTYGKAERAKPNPRRSGKGRSVLKDGGDE